ncbi:MAG TPA: hypothetical protein PKA10_07895 [Selenomonadales bacterium]|nr:hypothetical protein [Selenomonadales bacterium]
MTIQTKYIVPFVIILIVLAGAAYAGYHAGQPPAPPAVAEITPQQLADPAALQQIIGVQQAQIDKLMQAISAAQNQPPAITYQVQAPTAQAAADKVIQDVKQGNSMALQVPGQQTLVVPNTQQQTVDVYRVTTEHARWGASALVLAGGGKRPEVGVGAGWMNRDNAVAVGATTEQRFYLLGIHHF